MRKILTFILALLMLASFASCNGAHDIESGTDDEKTELDASVGESIYLGSMIAYPSIKKSDIISITISNGNKYSFERTESEDTETFLLYYWDENGEKTAYIPDDLSENEDYNDIYAVEENDGYGSITKLDHLISTFGTLLFESKVTLSGTEDERLAELKKYGFGEEGDPKEVTISYLSEGETLTHVIRIGNIMADGVGYYYTVDNRSYVYTSHSKQFNYVFAGYNEFIKSNTATEK